MVFPLSTLNTWTPVKLRLKTCKISSICQKYSVSKIEHLRGKDILFYSSFDIENLYRWSLVFFFLTYDQIDWQWRISLIVRPFCEKVVLEIPQEKKQSRSIFRYYSLTPQLSPAQKLRQKKIFFFPWILSDLSEKLFCKHYWVTTAYSKRLLASFCKVYLFLKVCTQVGIRSSPSEKDLTQLAFTC